MYTSYPSSTQRPLPQVPRNDPGDVSETFGYYGPANIFALHKHDYVTEEIAAARYATWLNHIDQATQPPPAMVGRSLPVRFLPWSGHGSRVITVPGAGLHAGTSRTVLRVQPAPWQSDGPLNFVLADFSYNLRGNQTDLQTTPDVDSRERPLVGDGVGGNEGDQVQSVANIPYQNIDPSDSGFSIIPAASGLLEDRTYEPAAQFMGMAVTFEVLVPTGATAEVTCIGQNEVRGIGYGEILSDQVDDTGTTWSHGNNGLQNKLMYPDHAEANNDFFIEAGVEIAGNIRNFKPSQVIVGNDQTETLSWFMPVAPAVPGQFLLLKPTDDANVPSRDSQFMMIMSNIVDVTTLGGNAHPANIGGIGTQTNRLFQFSIASGGTVDTTTANAAQPIDGQTTNEVVAIYHDMTKRHARSVLSFGQSMRAGMPVFELIASGGDVIVNVHYKAFYQFVTNTRHPAYEQAALGHAVSDRTVEEYKRWSATHSGTGRTIAHAITNSKWNTHANRPDHPKIQSLHIEDLADHKHTMILPRPGISQPINHEDRGVMQKLIGGIGSKMWSGITRGVGWLWGHRKEAGKLLETAGAVVSTVRPGLGAALGVGGGILEASAPGGFARVTQPGYPVRMVTTIPRGTALVAQGTSIQYAPQAQGGPASYPIVEEMF